MPESKLQKRLRMHDQKIREGMSHVERDDTPYAEPFYHWAGKVVWIPLVLIFIGLIFHFMMASPPPKYIYSTEFKNVLKLLDQADRVVLEKRLSLQKKYKRMENDPTWFVFPPGENDDMEIRPPHVTGLSDQPLISETNEKVLNRNRQLHNSMRALRDEQGAPDPDYQKLVKTLDEAEFLIEELKKEFPNRYDDPDSTLKVAENAVKAHREALKNDPEANLQENEKRLLFNWRKALLSRLIASERLKQESD